MDGWEGRFLPLIIHANAVCHLPIKRVQRKPPLTLILFQFFEQIFFFVPSNIKLHAYHIYTDTNINIMHFQLIRGWYRYAICSIHLFLFLSPSLFVFLLFSVCLSFCLNKAALYLYAVLMSVKKCTLNEKNKTSNFCFQW